MSSSLNGEQLFFNKIKNRCEVIFDVGCNRDSIFIDSVAEVHYFDPVVSYIEELKTKQFNNKKSVFNSFGLGNSNKTIPYYTSTGSFVERSIGGKETELYNIRKGNEYVQENCIKFIDFLKIDAELYELNVLEGFEDFLNNVKVIQFEYGPGTFTDLKIQLKQIINYLERYQFNDWFKLNWDTGELSIASLDDNTTFTNYIAFNKQFFNLYKDIINLGQQPLLSSDVNPQNQ